jgi:hypothetical protein
MGKLVAQGVLEHGEALDAVFAAASAKASADLCRSGLRARLSWQISDAAEGWRRSRRWADLTIRREIAPMVQARSKADAILAKAHEVNEAEGSPFLSREVVQVVAEELETALRTMRRGRWRVR